MNTSRRGFLQFLGSSALVLQASPTSFFDMGPSVALGAERGYNSFSSLDWIAREALKVLNKNLTFAKHVNRLYDNQFLTPGDIITIGGKFQVNPGPIYPVREWASPVHIVGEARS